MFHLLCTALSCGGQFLIGVRYDTAREQYSSGVLLAEMFALAVTPFISGEVGKSLFQPVRQSNI